MISEMIIDQCKDNYQDISQMPLSKEIKCYFAEINDLTSEVISNDLTKHSMK